MGRISHILCSKIVESIPIVQFGNAAVESIFSTHVDKILYIMNIGCTQAEEQQHMSVWLATSCQPVQIITQYTEPTRATHTLVYLLTAGIYAQLVVLDVWEYWAIGQQLTHQQTIGK